MYQALAVVLAIILVLDLIVMFFNDQIMRIPVLLPAIQLLGAILIFIQVALAIDTILSAIKLLGIIRLGQVNITARSVARRALQEQTLEE
jgi:hypothetical protein